LSLYCELTHCFAELQLFDSTDLYDNKTLTSIAQFEDLRNNSEVCTILFDKFVQCVVGKDKFRQHCLVTPPSKFTNEIDEAMTLLILSNNYEVWSEIGTLDLQERKKHRVGDLQSKQIYFVQGHGPGRSWSREGRKYYNFAFDMVKKDRFERGESFDHYFKPDWLRTMSRRVVRRKNSGRQRNRSRRSEFSVKITLVMIEWMAHWCHLNMVVLVVTMMRIALMEQIL
jgi:hypothetical protein